MSGKLAAVAAAAALGLSGCASIVSGTTQSIVITTPPTTGANCVLQSPSGSWTVTTPGSVALDKSKNDITIKCTKDGFQEAASVIPATFQGWTVGNILLGGLIGLGVDAATGALNEYPNAFEVPMTPMPGVTPDLAPTAQNTAPNS